MFESSLEIKNIAKALGQFHSKVESIERNKQGYNYMYATLDNVLDVIKEPLSESGLVFSQFPIGEFGLTTILIHTDSGEFFKTTSVAEPVIKNPQTTGSVITYLRRYHLVSILGLQVEDDDGASASSSVQNDITNPATPKGKLIDPIDKPVMKKVKQDKPWLNTNDPNLQEIEEKLALGEITIDDIKKDYLISRAMKSRLEKISEDNIDF